EHSRRSVHLGPGFGGRVAGDPAICRPARRLHGSGLTPADRYPPSSSTTGRWPGPRVTGGSGSAFAQLPEFDLDRHEIAPGKLLVRRIAQQIGGMQGRHGRNLDAARRGMDGPVAAHAHDAGLRTQKEFCGGISKGYENLRIHEFNMPLDEGAAYFRLKW